MNTSGTSSATKLIFGGPKLKRVSVTIQYKNNPENVVSGYALSHEILPEQVSFFAAQKFPVDEELTVTYQLRGEKKSYDVRMTNIHEQISSGRIMTAVPTEDNPFPARKFYRCYTSVIGADAAAKTTDEAKPADSVAAAPVEATAETSSAPAAENAVDAPPVEVAAKDNKIDLFAAEEPQKIEIPEAGGIAPVDMPIEEPKAA